MNKKRKCYYCKEKGYFTKDSPFNKHMTLCENESCWKSYFLDNWNTVEETDEEKS